MPGPPGVDVVGQQSRPSLHGLWVPVVQASPALPPPVGLQPTEAEVQMPLPPGVLLLAQQTSVVSPQALLVPVVQGQPNAGRDGSVQ